MKILSIDIGIKNLAFVILELNETNIKQHNASKELNHVKDFKILKWDVLNLCNKFTNCCENSCKKEAKFHKNNMFYCKNHTKKTDYALPPCNVKTLHKQTVKNLSLLAEQYEIVIDKPINKLLLIKSLEEHLNNTCFEAIETINANNVNLIDLGITLKNELNELFNKYDLSTIDQIILENQISPLANRMKTLQGMISQYFIDCNNYNIQFISAINKLKLFIKKENKEKKITYSERKKLSIFYTKQLLEEKNMTNELNFFTKHSKKDDLADCFLQGIYYLSNNSNNNNNNNL